MQTTYYAVYSQVVRPGEGGLFGDPAVLAGKKRPLLAGFTSYSTSQDYLAGRGIPGVLEMRELPVVDDKTYLDREVFLSWSADEGVKLHGLTLVNCSGGKEYTPPNSGGRLVYKTVRVWLAKNRLHELLASPAETIFHVKVKETPPEGYSRWNYETEFGRYFVAEDSPPHIITKSMSSHQHFSSFEEAQKFISENKNHSAYLPYGSAFYGESRDDDRVLVQLKGVGGAWLSDFEYRGDGKAKTDYISLDSTNRSFKNLVLACVATEYPEAAHLMPDADALLASMRHNAAVLLARAKSWPFDFHTRKALFAKRQLEMYESAGVFADTKSKLGFDENSPEWRLLFHQHSVKDHLKVFEALFGQEPQETVFSNGSILNAEGEVWEVVFDSCGLSVSDETTAKVVFLASERHDLDFPPVNRK